MTRAGSLRLERGSLTSVTKVGIEGAGRYGSPLARHLQDADLDVVEVPATLTFRERNRRRGQGKSDAVDAVAIARVVARGEGLASVQRNDVCVDLKLLSDFRDQLIHTRTQLANQVHRDLVMLVPGYERRIPNLTTRANLTKVGCLLRGLTCVRSQLVRRRVGEIRRIDAEVNKVTAQLRTKLLESKTTLTSIVGIGDIVAARLLGEVGDPRRIRSSAAFGMLSGTAPLQASSGTKDRHRFNRSGNRQLNRALHIIALTQARSHSPARVYVQGKRAEGKSHCEAIRCLKRHLANVVYRRMIEDAPLAEATS